MPIVIFSHTKTREREHLTDFLEEKKWFEHREFPVFLPKSKAEIEREILRKDELLKDKIARLQKAWKKIEKDYFQIVKKIHYKNIAPRYQCHISRYGTEGWSWRPNLFFVRLRTKRDERRAIETVGHELLHLLFSDLFESKKLTYAEREGMVDALILETDLEKLFPKYEKQSIGRVRRGLLGSILK
jgi:hypothetical protein